MTRSSLLFLALWLAKGCAPSEPGEGFGHGGPGAGGELSSGGEVFGSGGAVFATGGVGVGGHFFSGGALPGSGGRNAAGGASSSGAAGGSAPDSGGAGPSSGGAGPSSGGAESRPAVEPEPGTTLLRIDLDQKGQLFEGWGTSLCWWANRVGRFSKEGVDRLADALVDERTGLGYNIFRYNIGGGENPSHDHMQQFMDIEGFQSSDGVFHWDADPYQRAVLQSLVDRGDRLILEAFSNSPPYWMTESSCSAGNTDGSNNLRDDSYDAFAHYLTEVVAHFRDTSGIVFRTLEPLNEPNANWWRSGERQEGCHFSPSSQERIIRAVSDQLDAKGLTTVVSAADENSIDEALANLGSFSSETVAVLGQLNVHSYHGTRRRELRQLADTLGLRLWQSESGPLSVDVADDVEAALFMGGRIMSDLTEMGAEAWIDWQAGDSSRNWASFTLSDAQQTFQPLKRFYVQAAFSRFIRPGAQILDIEVPDVVAALNEDNESLVIVARNGTAQARAFTVDLGDLPAVGPEVEVARTSRTENLEPLSAIPIEGYSFVVSVPSMAIVSLRVRLP